VADSKTSALTAASVAALANEIPINEAGTSKKLTVQQIADLIGVQKARVGTRVTNSTTTGAEVTDLQFASLVAGTYLVQYFLICQSSATGTGLKFGINYTGTVTRMGAMMRYTSTGTTAVSGVMDGTITAAGGTMMEGAAAITETTTAPNLGPTGGVATANENLLTCVEAVVVVSDGGNLEFYHASETAAQTSIEVGSCAVITRIS